MPPTDPSSRPFGPSGLLFASLSLALLGCAGPSVLRDEWLAAPSSREASAFPPEGLARPSGAVRPEPRSLAVSRSAGLPWAPGQALLQGFLGFTTFEHVSADGNGTTIDGDEGDLDSLPLIGGGGQWKFGGERLDFGLEGMLSFSGKANAVAFAAGGGGAAIAVDVDLLLFDLYGGPFVSLFLGDRLRLYGAAGPLLEWAQWDQTGNALDAGGSGFGVGAYARTGFELALPSRTLVGFGVRWSDTTVDLGRELGDLEVDGLQLLFTVSRGL